MNKQQIKAFLSTFWTENEIEINNLKRAISLDEALELNKKWENIYFVASVKDNTKRNKDNDIKDKNYFIIDLDVREQKPWITDDEIKEYAAIIKNSLQWALANYRFINYSWNWLHFYYVWEPTEFDKTTYQNGIKYILKQFEKAIQKTWIKPDYACSNIARIIRLPWTMNWGMKTKHGLKPKECEIIEQTDKSFDISLIKVYSRQYEQEQKLEQSKLMYEQEQKRILKDLTIRESKVFDEICKIDLSEIIASEFGLTMRQIWNKVYFYWNNETEPKWFRYNQDNNTLYHWWSSTWNWWTPWKTYNTFSYIKERERLWNKETFERFAEHYRHIQDLVETEKQEFVKNKKSQKEKDLKKEIAENFQHIAIWDALDRWIDELVNTNPNDIIKWWWNHFDDYLWWIYTWKIYLIWAETWTWKSTFVNLVSDNIVATWKKVVKYSLEDRLEDKTKEDLFYSINRIRKKDGKEPYVWTKFVNNEYYYEDEDYLLYIDKARDVLANKKIIVLDRKKPIWIDELVVLITDEAKKWTKFFVIDHLHYFKFKNQERTDLEIQNVMHKLNDVVRKENIALFLVAHYKWNTSKEKHPTPDMFKDWAAIKQVANIIIQLEQADDENGEPCTKFHFTKLRWPIPKKIICAHFDYNLFNYVDFWIDDEQDDTIQENNALKL